MRRKAPFLVTKSVVRPGQWCLYMREPELKHKGYFDTQAEAVDYAHKNWPWWP